MAEIQKPRVLMLHGGGTSATIFTIQTRKVIWSLKKYFDFQFLDAPWESPPGPGVLPTFADAGPYYRWARWYESEDGDLLKQRLRSKLQEPGGTWVGLLGFSQGGRLAAGLLWDQERGKLDDFLPGLDFKFGVFVGASYPVLHLSHGPKGSFNERDSKEYDPKYLHSIHVPSVHVQGQQDHVLPAAKLMAQCFDPNMAKILTPNIPHQMPLEEDENKALCDAILEAYREGGGVLNSGS